MNIIVGTVAYSAPEQLMGLDIDGRTDQYALAATDYHLLTGEQLFPNSNPPVVISRHLNADPPPLSASHPELAPLDAALTHPVEEPVTTATTPRCQDFAQALNAACNPTAQR